MGPAGRPNVKTCCCSDNHNKKLPYRRIGYVFIIQKTLPFIVAGGMLAASHGALAKQITIGMSFQEMNNDYFVTMKQALDQAAADIGAKVYVADAP